MGKRGNREGSVYQRWDGRWAAAFTIEGGRRKTLYGRTRQEVARKLARALSEQQAGIPPADERLRVGAYLSDWLEGMQGVAAAEHLGTLRTVRASPRRALPRQEAAVEARSGGRSTSLRRAT